MNFIGDKDTISIEGFQTPFRYLDTYFSPTFPTSFTSERYNSIFELKKNLTYGSINAKQLILYNLNVK